MTRARSVARLFGPPSLRASLRRGGRAIVRPVQSLADINIAEPRNQGLIEKTHGFERRRPPREQPS